MNYFKAELYRFIHSNYKYSTLGLVIFYTIFGNYVYKANGFSLDSLYNCFGEEYLLIFLILSFGMIIFLFADDLNNKLYYEYNRNYMCIVKIILWLLYIAGIIILTLIFSLIFSFAFNMTISISFKLVSNVIKVLPIIMVYNLVLIIMLFIGVKTSYATTMILGLYVLFNYLEVSLINIENNIIKYFVMFNLNFNNLYIPWYYAMFILVVFISILGLIIKLLFEKMT